MSRIFVSPHHIFWGEQLRVDNSFMARTLRLCALAPVIVESILDGTYPDTINLESLRKPIPLSWQEQATHFGISTELPINQDG